MRVPTVASYISQFYPIGNTPAVSLTRSLPQGVDADILLLGAGDIRNILYTTYANAGLPPRKLNFTCCDIQSAVAGRNILLLSLIIDKNDKHDSSVLWNIYYDLYLTNASATIVEAQLEKLLALSSSLETWRQSQYGEVVSFCDEGTLGLTRDFWNKCLAAARAADRPTYVNELRRTQQLFAGQEGAFMLTGLRSASPVAIHAMQILPHTHNQYWKTGSLTEPDARLPNPLIGSILLQHTLLHRATDPVLGFHLATAVAKLAPASPLRIDSQSEGMEQLVKAATTQFREWIVAFQSQLKHGVNVAFAIADALNFCQALTDARVGGNNAATVYRRQFDMSGYELDSNRYSSSDNTNLLFDVVDTSNLADHLGAVNLLVLASPLLKPICSSTLYIETLMKGASHRLAELDELLLGHAPMTSLILGVSAVDSWTNATSSSVVDAVMIGSAMNNGNESHLHSRIAWKRDCSASVLGGPAPMLYVDPEVLSGVFFSIYHRMFEYEDPSGFMGASQDQMLVVMRKSAYPKYHRGSLVALLKHARTTIDTDWPLVYKSLKDKIGGDHKMLLGGLYVQELAVQMHTMGVFTDKWLQDNIKRDSEAEDFGAWNEIPAVVAVTLVVPRARFDKIYVADPSKMSAPTLQVGLSSSRPDQWKNLFADVQLAFGTVTPRENPKNDAFQVSVEPDSNGWSGSSDLVASFMVPTALLQAEPGSARISLRIQTTAQSLSTYRNAGFGPEMIVYETNLADSEHVFVTKSPPGLPALASDLGSQLQPTTGTERQFKITADVDTNSARLLSLTGHIDVTTDQGKSLLADKVPIELRQSSPFTIEIVFGKDRLVLPITYPVPVDQQTSKTRIARKSSYVEVIAPLADPLKSKALASYIYPTMIGPNAVPITLNGQNLGLDGLPIINLDPEHKRFNQWLVTLTSAHFSVREKLLRDTGKTAEGVNKDLRVNFKESIFTMFMLSSGLQGGQTGLFSLNQPDKGICILIIIQCIRIDAAAGSVVMDAAILPLTLDLVVSRKLEDFFLVMRELEICAITVNDEELRLWKQAIPDMVERCRTWSHTADCEYKKSGAKIPLSLEMGEQFLCSCGQGKLAKNYMKLPEWEKASRYMVRAAISPAFSAPFVEEILDMSAMGQGQGMGQTTDTDKCRNCGKTQKADGGNLMQCARCKEVAYCSKECQKADWKKHRQECF
ncbi:MYND finger family protein [Apiospora arundinis]